VLLGDLPPGEKWRNFELKALGLRDFARVHIDQPLNPFELARFANLLVVRFDEVAGLSENARAHLLGQASENWSGGAVTLPNGMKLVILNPTHGRSRTNATLMEEICHVFLGHQPNRLSIVTKDERGKVMNRDYRKADEEEAYGVGAAALVPYASLKKLLLQGRTSTDIAQHFRVSPELVEYRMKVTHLWREHKDLARSSHKKAQKALK
jgi:IrrE N-terminal-like domain